MDGQGCREVSEALSHNKNDCAPVQADIFDGHAYASSSSNNDRTSGYYSSLHSSYSSLKILWFFHH